MLARSTPWRRSSRRSPTRLIAAPSAPAECDMRLRQIGVIGLGQLFIYCPYLRFDHDPEYTENLYSKKPPCRLSRKRRMESANLQRLRGARARRSSCLQRSKLGRGRHKRYLLADVPFTLPAIVMYCPGTDVRPVRR